MTNKKRPLKLEGKLEVNESGDLEKSIAADLARPDKTIAQLKEIINEEENEEEETLSGESSHYDGDKRPETN